MSTESGIQFLAAAPGGEFVKVNVNIIINQLYNLLRVNSNPD
jgi:hypothetical protein